MSEARVHDGAVSIKARRRKLFENPPWTRMTSRRLLFRMIGHAVAVGYSPNRDSLDSSVRQRVRPPYPRRAWQPNRRIA